jgi:hypothetical protein
MTTIIMTMTLRSSSPLVGGEEATRGKGAVQTTEMMMTETMIMDTTMTTRQR